jgi:uncharacterized protein (TIRG00374 family)
MTITKTRLLLLGKLLLGLALLAFLVSKADLANVIKRLYTLDLTYVAIVFILPHVGIWLSTVKWKTLLRALGVEQPMARLLGLYMIGTFFNNFFPTMVGGDVVKAYQLSRETGEAPSVIAATFMERFVGLAALVSLLPLVLLQREVLDKFPAFGLAILLVILGFTISLFLIFSNVANRLPGANSSLPIIRQLSTTIQKARTQVRFFKRDGPILTLSYFISILFYLVTAAASWAATKSTGADVDFTYLLSVVPVILLTALIPVSINGLGITETGYVIFLRLAGVSMLDAVTMALLLRIRVLFTAILGALIFLVYKPALPRKPLSTDQSALLTGMGPSSTSRQRQDGQTDGS